MNYATQNPILVSALVAACSAATVSLACCLLWSPASPSLASHQLAKGLDGAIEGGAQGVGAEVLDDIASMREELQGLRNSLANPRQEVAFHGELMDSTAMEGAVRAAVESALREHGVLPEDEASEGSDVQPLPETAEACVDAILALGVTSDDASLLWAQAEKADRLHEILAAWQARADSAPGTPEMQLELAQAYYEAAHKRPSHDGNWWRASDDAYSDVLKLDPNHWEARYQKAVHLAFWPPAYGGQARAVRHLTTLVEQQESSGVVEPKQAKVYRWLGNLLDQQGRSDEARAIWQQGALRHPDDRSLQEKLGG